MTISADDAADLGPDGGSPNDLCQEDVEDAILEGDRTFAAGTARAALRYPTFRIVFFGAFLSNIGSWMQNVVLGAFAYKLTGSPVFVSLLGFAQLVPLLLLSIVAVSAPWLRGQVVGGTIQGTATDASGAVVAGVKIINKPFLRFLVRFVEGEDQCREKYQIGEHRDQQCG